MPRVSNEEFVSRLTALYEASSSSGSVYLTSKRITHSDGLKDAQGDSAMSDADAAQASPHPLIFRASNGKDDKARKVAFSTQVDADSLGVFQNALQPALRTQASVYLRKRDKAKERKLDKAVAARKKKDEELGGWKGVAKQGSKRGAGHRQQQRAKRRALKLRKEESLAARRKAAAAAASGGATAVPESATAAATTTTTTTAPSQQQPSSSSQAASSSASKKKKKKGGKK